MSDEAVRLGVLCTPVPLAAVVELERQLRRSHHRAELRLDVDDLGDVVVFAELCPSEVEPPRALDPEGPMLILECVRDAFDVDVDEMVGRSRSREVVPARHAAMYLCRELTDLSLPAIARFFDGRDHTTVLHGIDATRRRLEASANHRARLDRARAAYHARGAWLPGLEPTASNDGRLQLRALGER